MENPPGCSDEPHSTPGATGSPRFFLLVFLVAVIFASACISPAPLPDAPAAEERPPRSLRVRLVFGEEADLDLYVTDPKLETVYFGNSPSLGGGVLAKDQRCGDPAPRVESVTFVDPVPGRYRVGVEFSTRCGRVRGAVPFAITVETDAGPQELRGKIEPAAFLPVVLEVELAGAGTAAPQ